MNLLARPCTNSDFVNPCCVRDVPLKIKRDINGLRRVSHILREYFHTYVKHACLAPIDLV